MSLSTLSIPELIRASAFDYHTNNLLTWFCTETNLKKQGMLPLTFQNPADYDKVAPDDKITLKVSHLAPGKPLPATIHKKDGKTIDISLSHTVCIWLGNTGTNCMWAVGIASWCCQAIGLLLRVPLRATRAGGWFDSVHPYHMSFADIRPSHNSFSATRVSWSGSAPALLSTACARFPDNR